VVNQSTYYLTKELLQFYDTVLLTSKDHHSMTEPGRKHQRCQGERVRRGELSRVLRTIPLTYQMMLYLTLQLWYQTYPHKGQSLVNKHKYADNDNWVSEFPNFCQNFFYAH